MSAGDGAGTPAGGLASTARAAYSGSSLRRFDTLALRLFVLMWATLVLSHAVAYLLVNVLHAPFGGPPAARVDDRPAPPAATREAPPREIGPPPRPRGDAPAAPPHARNEPPGRPPLPTLGSLPPTPGVPQVTTGGRNAGPPPLPTQALALDYGVRMLVIALAAWWGARWLARPMGRLVDAARALGAGLSRGRAPAPLDESRGTSEVRDTATVFNQMAAQIRQLFESRGLMMASISHDLRTPLTRMRMRVETADLPPALRERCVADLAEMNALIDAVLDIFRAGAGQARELQRLDVATLLQALVDDHAEQGRAVSATLPAQPVVLRSDALALRRVVDNLVVNAIRYAGRAEVVLAQAPEGVRIRVEDRGPGIAPDRLADVLQPFVRLESSRNRATGGAGLGLAIANELVQALGGELTLSNRAGGGLSAQVWLPASAAAP